MRTNIDNANNLEGLIAKLKKEDSHYANICKRLQVFYWILIPFYLVLVVVQIFEESTLVDVLGSVAYMIAMLIFAVFFRNYYKEYTYVDYSLPTLQMLKAAVYRYTPFQLKQLWVLLAVFFVDVGLSISSSSYFDLIDIQIFFVGSMVLATGVGLIWWFKRYKPLRDDALKLVKEIEGD